MIRRIIMGTVIVSVIFFKAWNAFASIDAKTIIDNIEKNNNQRVLTGQIDSLVIKRGNAEFHLGPGELTLYNFGSSRIAAMSYKGDGHFRYTPPDLAELGQIAKFTGKGILDGPLKNAAFFFTVDLNGLPDTSKFTVSTADKSGWDILEEARAEEFDHVGINITNKLIGDLLSPDEGTYFNAYFSLDGVGDLIFQEDPYADDLYSVYKPVKVQGAASADMLSGYSPDNDLPSQRGVMPIDITHYDIASKIESSGKMMVKCQIVYTPLRSGRQYFYLTCYNKNKIISALDSNGDSLLIVRLIDKEGLLSSRLDEFGFGLVLNRLMQPGQPDSIEIEYECKALKNFYEVYYIDLAGHTFWYPRNSIYDQATYNLSFDCPDYYQVVASGNLIESTTENDRSISKWVISRPVSFVSFNVGRFEEKTISAAGITPVKVFLSKNIPHQETAQTYSEEGITSLGNMMGAVGADVANSLAFFSSMFGPCPFDTIRVTEIPMEHGQGPPGLLHLSWNTFQYEDISGLDVVFRAHEAAHQWWGHVVGNESYRDTWINEGLAEYCGYWFFESSTKDKKKSNYLLDQSRQKIFSGDGALSMGNKAGPVTMGYRLTSSVSDDYSPIVYEKGAYIFHMIRYLLHDYKTASDDAFAAFLKDLASKYRGDVITTSRLQKLLDEHTGQDMSWFFNQWVYSTEIPKYSFRSKVTKGDKGKYLVTCHIKQENVSPSFKMPVPLTVLFDGDKYVNLTVWVDKPEMDIDLPLLPYKPKKIIFNTYDAVLAAVNYN